MTKMSLGVCIIGYKNVTLITNGLNIDNFIRFLWWIFFCPCFRKIWEHLLEAATKNGSLIGMTWTQLRGQLDGAEIKKTYVLNPLAPEFVPSRQLRSHMMDDEHFDSNLMNPYGHMKVPAFPTFSLYSRPFPLYPQVTCFFNFTLPNLSNPGLAILNKLIYHFSFLFFRCVHLIFHFTLDHIMEFMPLSILALHMDLALQGNLQLCLDVVHHLFPYPKDITLHPHYMEHHWLHQSHLHNRNSSNSNNSNSSNNNSNSNNCKFHSHLQHNCSNSSNNHLNNSSNSSSSSNNNNNNNNNNNAFPRQNSSPTLLTL